jgi:hypothetical protein
MDSVKIYDESNLNIMNDFKPSNNISGFSFFRNINNNQTEIIMQVDFAGIFKLNLLTHSATLMKAGCSDRFISSPTVSSDGNKISYALYKDENTEANPCSIKRNPPHEHRWYQRPSAKLTLIYPGILNFFSPSSFGHLPFLKIFDPKLVPFLNSFCCSKGR